MKYKVYIHKTETDDRVFYVGFSKSKYRPYSNHSRSKEWLQIYNNEGLIVEILYETDNKEVALFLEGYLIQEYGRICDDGTLVNKSIYSTFPSNETKQKISKTKKGKKHTDETKQKIRESHKKPIIQYTKDGTFIREWESITEAGETLNIHKGHIGYCCKRKLKTSGGFIWKYK